MAEPLEQINSHEPVGDTSLDSNNATMKSPVTSLMTDVPSEINNDMTWRGGEHFFEGTHDRFCFSCGASDDVVGCQTCSRCYHSQCMFPPLDPSQVPDVWFCPVCVGRNWHTPLNALQTPAIPTSRDAAISNNLLSAPAPSETGAPTSSSIDNSPAKEAGTEPLYSEGRTVTTPISDSQRNEDLEIHNQRWKEAQRWKENAWYAPRGYVLDPQCGERFISLYGKAPLSLSSVLKNRTERRDTENENDKPDNHSDSRPSVSSSVPEAATSRGRRARVQKSPSKKRSKYSELPKDLEKALELITSNLESVSRSRRSQDEGDTKARALEQQLRIQEGEVLICRQEIQAVKQRLLDEISAADILRSENAELRQKLQESQALAESKESELRNWQGMLRTMVGNRDGPSTG